MDSERWTEAFLGFVAIWEQAEWEVLRARERGESTAALESIAKAAWRRVQSFSGPAMSEQLMAQIREMDEVAK